MAIIGIDLGTTNSLGAVFRNEKVELIPNRFGTYLTPSVVSIDEQENIIVGQIAKERLISAPQCTVASFKRNMGTNTIYTLGTKSFSPEELSSFVIRSILEDAKLYLQEEIEEAIISVPAYFNDKQRVATKKAGALAGIKVERIINEPSAAALSSYLDSSKEEQFLVFDFGGGTLDVSIVDCFDTMVEILSVAGDNHLGGDDFHQIMADSFLKEHGIAKDAISPAEHAILLKHAERCKQELSEKEHAVMDAVIGDTLYQSEYTNERLLEESRGLLNRIKQVILRAFKDGELTMQEIDTVVMVGGSSKMPLIQSYLDFLLKQKPVVADQCDEKIARGLGLVCAVKERQETMKDYILTDICPFTLGTEILNEANPDKSYMAPIIPKNSVLPCSHAETYCTSFSFQTKLKISILQGEGIYADENLCLDKIEIHVPRNIGGAETIDVRYTYDINGILLVDITINSTGEKISKVVSQSISEAELQEKIQELSKLKVHPRDMEENKLICEKLSAFYAEAAPSLRETIHAYLEAFEYALNTQDSRKIRKYKKTMLGLIESLEQHQSYEEMFIFSNQSLLSELDEEDDENEDEPEEEDIFTFHKNGGTTWTS